MAKYHELVDKLAQRIRHGDYRLKGFPSHIDLVSEFGVNSRTMTKALQELVHAGLLVRTKAGRVVLAEGGEKTGLFIGLLVPVYPSPFMLMWHWLIDRLTRKRGWILDRKSVV